MNLQLQIENPLKKREISIAVAAAAVAVSAAAAGYSAYSQTQAGNAAAKAAGQTKTIPLPGYADALNKDVARTVALNMGQTPPSLATYEASGGTAKFPFIDLGMTPQERQQLGLVGAGNTPVPFQGRTTAGQPMTLDQILFLGRQKLQQGGNAAQSPTAKLFQRTQKLKHLQEEPNQNLKTQTKESKLQGRISKQESNQGV